MSHTQACLPGSAWLVGDQETHQICTVEHTTPARFTRDSNFLVNWCLICSWQQNACPGCASRRSAAEASALFAFIGFSGWFHTSLVHLMQWKIDTDGLKEKQPKDGRSLDTCAHPGPLCSRPGKHYSHFVSWPYDADNVHKVKSAWRLVK